MRVLHAAAELLPWVRTGGLGDVLAALPPAQAALGLEVRLILPAYPALLGALVEDRTPIPLGPVLGIDAVRLRRGRADGTGPALYLVEAPCFDRPGNPYLGPDGLDWPDNALRFGLLCRVAAQVARGFADPDWRADILHAHDWHAGLAPAYLDFAHDGVGTGPGSVFTIHNLAFQGLFPAATAAALELPATSFTPADLEFWGQVSFMKAGLIHADRITTVSPGYAREIATAEFGCGLEGVIADRRGDVSGILNGVDPGVWDPARDPILAAPFEAGRMSGRRANRVALLAEAGLPAGDGPICGVVSRLTGQKGLDLLLDCLPAWLAAGGRLILLGAGDADLETGFRAAAAANPDQVAVTIGYDDGMAHRIIAGADLIAVPSRFEPCGLTQLYALRYGAVPVVRRTGGLGDTVTDATAASLKDGTATGFVFDGATPSALAAALDRAAALYRRPEAWARLQAAGMARRFDWGAAALAYEALYEAIRPSPATRRGFPPAEPRSAAARPAPAPRPSALA